MLVIRSRWSKCLKVLRKLGMWHPSMGLSCKKCLLGKLGYGKGLLMLSSEESLSLHTLYHFCISNTLLNTSSLHPKDLSLLLGSILMNVP